MTRPPLALLVIHGIGSQQRGELLESCVAGLQQTYPSATLLDRSGTRITCQDITKRALDEVRLTEGSWVVHLYEVYWADILSGPQVDGSFNKFLFEETTWFPWLNWTSGLLSPSEYSSWLIGFRTAQMWFLALAATIMYEIVPKRLHSSVLDQIVADVWNYTHSLGGVLPTDSPIHDTAPRILERVRHTAAKAHLDGCREIQIVAHSLGTVIAFNALTRYPASAVDNAPMSITHLYTIGSPLEKFLFIWHRTLRPSLRSPEIQLDGQILASGHRIQWQNFYSPLDMVSGKLMRFTEWGHVVNTRLWGLGGLARAHINYFRHPAVLTALAAGLGGNPQPVKLPLVNRISWYLIGVGENFLTPMMVLVALLLGLLVFLLFGALAGAIFGALLYGILGWLINPLLENFGVAITLADTVYWTALTCAVFMIMGVVVFTTKDGYRRAKTTHQKFWR
jgi:hypothetical protein